jgi:hypothetical protein
MTTPTDNAEPLDPNERELARVLRALPGGEPPAALDARILKAASDAVAVPAPRRKRALWAAGGSTGALWGIGSAAAAVLAIGIAWQVNTPPDSGIPVPRTLPTAADEAADEATTVDFVPMPEREYDNSGPPPPPPPAEAQRRSDVQAAPQREQAKPSAPAPAMEPYIDEHVESRQAAKSERGADVDFAASPPPATAPAPAASDAASAGMLARDRAETAGAAAEASEQLDAIVVSGTRIQKEAPADARARVFNDRLLEPDPWLARIRERWTEGDHDGARASLRLYVERHPDRSIPTDLRPLLEE